MGYTFNDIKVKAASPAVSEEELDTIALQLGYNIYPINKVYLPEGSDDKTEFTSEELQLWFKESSLYLTNMRIMIVTIPGDFAQGLREEDYNLELRSAIDGYRIELDSSMLSYWYNDYDYSTVLFLKVASNIKSYTGSHEVNLFIRPKIVK